MLFTFGESKAYALSCRSPSEPALFDCRQGNCELIFAVEKILDRGMCKRDVSNFRELNDLDFSEVSEALVKSGHLPQTGIFELPLSPSCFRYASLAKNKSPERLENRLLESCTSYLREKAVEVKDPEERKFYWAKEILWSRSFNLIVFLATILLCESVFRLTGLVLPILNQFIATALTGFSIIYFLFTLLSWSPLINFAFLPIPIFFGRRFTLDPKTAPKGLSSMFNIPGIILMGCGLALLGIALFNPLIRPK